MRIIPDNVNTINPWPYGRDQTNNDLASAFWDGTSHILDQCIEIQEWEWRDIVNGWITECRPAFHTDHENIYAVYQVAGMPFALYLKKLIELAQAL